MRRTAGNRKHRTTTIALSPLVEELLEQVLESGSVESVSEAARLGIELFAREQLGDERVDEVVRAIQGEELPSGN